MRTLAVTLAAAAALAVSALADATMSISLSAQARIVSRTEADVPISVSCAALDNQTSGSVAVSLVQQAGSKTTSATGSTPITCDGQPHDYLVQVVADDGRWHNGEATASASGAATGSRSITVCTTNSDGVTQCTTGTAPERDEGIAGPAKITLGNG